MTLLSRFRWWRRLHNCEQAIITLEGRCRELEHQARVGTFRIEESSGVPYEYDATVRAYVPKNNHPWGGHFIWDEEKKAYVPH